MELLVMLLSTAAIVAIVHARRQNAAEPPTNPGEAGKADAPPGDATTPETNTASRVEVSKTQLEQSQRDADAAARAAQDRATAAEQALAAAQQAARDQSSDLEARVRESNAARDAAREAAQQAQQAQQAAAAAQREHEAAVRDATATVLRLQPQLDVIDREKADVQTRVAMWPQIVADLAHRRQVAAESIVRYPEVLGYELVGPDFVTTQPYRGNTRAVDQESPEGLTVQAQRFAASSNGQPDPYPFVRLVILSEVQTRSTINDLGRQLNDAVTRRDADVSRRAELLRQRNVLLQQIAPARAALGLTGGGGRTPAAPITSGPTFNLSLH